MKQTLYFKDARSDKEYTLEIRPDGSLFHVYFAFGRRGGTQQTGCKTARPVSRAAAEKLYHSLAAEKRAKGYQPGPTASPLQYAETQTLSVDVQAAPTHASRVPPMLLNPIDQDEAQLLIADDDWLMQPKYDGNRVQLVRVGGDVRGFSRPGLPVSLPASLVTAALSSPRDFNIDGELIGDLFVCFDILEDGAIDMKHERCEFRTHHLQTLWPHTGIQGIVSSPVALTRDDKQMFYDMIHAQGGEGVVFKRKSAPYSSGRPNSAGDARKCKFWATASVIVGLRHPTKSSFEMLLCDGTHVGSLTVSAKDGVQTGQIVEVRYLDRGSANGHLKQATFLRLRQDIPREDCTEAQLHVKGAKRA
jgi:ATP-dependent DNA ligase